MTPSPERPSAGYLASVAAAMVGMVALAVAIEGTRRSNAGLDGLGAFNSAGVPALVFAWALAFYARLAFSARIAPATRALVAASVRIIFAVEVLIAVGGTWFVLRSGVSNDLIGILIAGDVAQIGTLIWLIRYGGHAT